MEILPASDRSLLICFGEEISVEAHQQVRRLLGALHKPPAGILNLHPAFASILIDFDPRRRRHADVEEWIRSRFDSIDPTILADSRTIDIPVTYGAEYGPDLDDVACHTGLDPAEVIAKHSAATYLVYFLGFSPGFPYLGGLPPELATPRLSVPRKSVPAGSVAIGGSQTGIYPMESPGGWRIIGRTHLRLFDAQADVPALLRIGDSVRFVPANSRRA